MNQQIDKVKLGSLLYWDSEDSLWIIIKLPDPTEEEPHYLMYSVKQMETIKYEINIMKSALKGSARILCE